MTSQLNVDTIVDKAGSGGSNVKMANTSTYVSEGGAVSQNTVQGVTKAWLQLDGTGTISTLDSLNSSSISDLGVGRYRTNFSNNMNNDDYAVTASDTFQTAGYYSPITSGHNIFCNNENRAGVDTTVSATVHGDLA